MRDLRRFAKEGTDPRILDAPLGRGLTARRLLAALAPGVVGLVLGAPGLVEWAGRLPPGWVQGWVAGWAGWVVRMGLAWPYLALHHAFQGFATLGFGS